MSPRATLVSVDGFAPEVATDVLVIGAGACGLTAALAASEAGASVLVVERDAQASGSTALSAGLIPAAGTRFQIAAGIDDTPDLFAADIQRKAAGEADATLVAGLAGGSAAAVAWLAEAHGLPFSVVTDFDYPGHSRRRMHGLPSRSGRELIDRLRNAAEAAALDIVCNREAIALAADGAGRIAGAVLARPDGGREAVGAGAVVLACNGYGGNPGRVRRHMPEIADALYFGHAGNQGHALDWGEALSAATRDLGAYQGHGSVAHPEGILITWAAMGEGGFQINRDGRRFWDESQGYSEAARAVLGQPGGVAWAIFDGRIAAIARQFEDFRQAEAAGALRWADDAAGLADATGLPVPALTQTLADVDAAKAGAADAFGRRFAGLPALAAPFCAVRVTGALFHTQGGLAVDDTARVLRADGAALPNLFAAGGAACGVSGSGDSGYLSGNGLLSAVVLGRVAGQSAARLVQSSIG